MFDFEGTLVDFQWRLAEGEAALRRRLRALGYAPEQLDGLTYSGMWNRAIEEPLPGVGEETLRQHLGPVYDRFDHDALSRWRPRPGAAATLAAVHSYGLRVGMVSNIGRVALQEALARFDLALHLELILTRDDLRLMKPDPEGILRCLDSWGLSPREALFVGDSRTDILAARAAAVRVAILRGGESSTEVLALCPPDFVLQELDQLEELVALAGAQPV